jgi:hypothetical protein
MHEAMNPRQVKTSALAALALVGAACGGGTPSVQSTTTTRAETSVPLTRVIRAGELTFRIPGSWAVGYGTCRCAWGLPDTATLDNGPETGGVACNCPEESSDAPSGLHLYEGRSGLSPGGQPTTVNGLRAVVSLDTSDATLVANVPAINQWVTISPGPRPARGSTRQQEVAVERRILATLAATSDMPTASPAS